jgi:hypothetical protein
MFFEINFKKQRTNLSLVLYALYLVTLGLSYRKASRASALFYIEACRSLKLVHRTYEFGDWFFEAIKREVQVLKDRTENFSEYFCSKKVYRLDKFGLIYFTCLVKRK